MIVFVIFELVAVAVVAQYYFRFQIRWLSSKGRKLSANQISTTYLNPRLRYK